MKKSKNQDENSCGPKSVFGIKTYGNCGKLAENKTLFAGSGLD